MDSFKKKNENNFSKRTNHDKNISQKESKNQTTLEQQRFVHFDSISLGKIKKRLAKKSHRGISEQNKNNRFKIINNKYLDNNLTIINKKSLKCQKKKSYSKKNEFKSKRQTENLFNKKKSLPKQLSGSNKFYDLLSNKNKLKDKKQSIYLMLFLNSII